jgi:hypothetical protein
MITFKKMSFHQSPFFHGLSVDGNLICSNYGGHKQAYLAQELLLKESQLFKKDGSISSLPVQ